MAKSVSLTTSDELDVFAILALRYLDGECSTEEASALKAMLVEGDSHRELFVQLCRLHGDLHEMLAPTKLSRHQEMLGAAEPAAVSAKASAVQTKGAACRRRGGSKPGRHGTRRTTIRRPARRPPQERKGRTRAGLLCSFARGSDCRDHHSCIVQGRGDDRPDPQTAGVVDGVQSQAVLRTGYGSFSQACDHAAPIHCLRGEVQPCWVAGPAISSARSCRAIAGIMCGRRRRSLRCRERVVAPGEPGARSPASLVSVATVRPTKAPPSSAICVLAPSVFCQEGGIQRIPQMVLRQLRRTWPDSPVHVLTLHDPLPLTVPAGFAADVETGAIVFRPHQSGRFKFASAVLRTLADTRPQLIVSLHAHLNSLPWLATPLARAPLVSLVYHAELATLGLLRRHALRHADLVLAISEFTAREVRPLLRPDQPLAVCHLGLFPDYPLLAHVRQPVPRSLDGRRVILSVGRMVGGTRDKGQETLLAALPGVVQRYPEALLVLVGRGADEPRLRRLAQARGLSAHVHFAGFVRDAELPAYYEACELFAMPSVAEGFGLVYLEAMHHARPCIAGNRDAAGEVIVDGQTGLLVEPGNVPQLGNALLRLLADPAAARRMGQAGRARLDRCFTSRQFEDRLARELEPFAPGLRPFG